jgi:adenylate cyclase class 2
MKYEVECKHPVADAAETMRRLAKAGAVFSPAEEQVDRYFAHPARDFARTDEALRIRSVGERNCLTYKGPKLDLATKTRQEIEVDFAPGQQAATDLGAALVALGFRPVAAVRKLRRKAALAAGGWPVEAAWDEVAGLGTFLELETTADDDGLDAARAALLELAASLKLGPSERRSYLELLT